MAAVGTSRATLTAALVAALLSLIAGFWHHVRQGEGVH